MIPPKMSRPKPWNLLMHYLHGETLLVWLRLVRGEIMDLLGRPKVLKWVKFPAVVRERDVMMGAGSEARGQR